MKRRTGMAKTAKAKKALTCNNVNSDTTGWDKKIKPDYCCNNVVHCQPTYFHSIWHVYNILSTGSIQFRRSKESAKQWSFAICGLIVWNSLTSALTT